MWRATGWRLAACPALGSLASGCAVGLVEQRALREHPGSPTAPPASAFGTPRATFVVNLVYAAVYRAEDSFGAPWQKDFRP